MEKSKSKIKSKLFVLILGISFMALFFNSCKSTRQTIFLNDINLQVFIIDENNNPVSDFKVCYSKEENGFKSEEVYSDEKGFCRFENVNTGKYFIWGYKDGFKKLEGIQVHLSRATDVFFCVTESKEKVFEAVNALYKSQRYEEGIELIGKLKAGKGSVLEAGILYYEFFGFKCSGNENEAEKKLKELRKTKIDEIKQLVD